jgi:hypothetical protein
MPDWTGTLSARAIASGVITCWRASSTPITSLASAP